MLRIIKTKSIRCHGDTGYYTMSSYFCIILVFVQLEFCCTLEIKRCCLYLPKRGNSLHEISYLPVRLLSSWSWWLTLVYKCNRNINNIIRPPRQHLKYVCIHEIRLGVKLNSTNSTKCVSSIFLQLLKAKFEKIILWKLCSNRKKLKRLMIWRFMLYLTNLRN